MTYNLLVVCGPTASGKTRMGVALAGAIGAEIISVDSRQVYRGMDVGTGKDLREYHGPDGDVAYHLIDIAAPEEVYTLWHYQRDFYRVLSEIRGRGNFALAVGGTGLYLEAVLKHYRIPSVPENKELRRALMQQPQGVLEARLQKISPELYAAADKTSKKRVVRSLEVALHAAEHEIDWGPENSPEINPFVIAIRWPREVLRERIRKRLLQRLDQGMIEEVKGLLDVGISPERLDSFGLEYRHVNRYLQRRVSREEMISDLLRDIRRFAKRQDSYFRGMQRRGIPVYWVDDADIVEAEKMISPLIGFSKEWHLNARTKIRNQEPG